VGRSPDSSGGAAPQIESPQNRHLDLLVGSQLSYKAGQLSTPTAGVIGPRRHHGSNTDAATRQGSWQAGNRSRGIPLQPERSGGLFKHPNLVQKGKLGL
jgi:hypothetical protein